MKIPPSKPHVTPKDDISPRQKSSNTNTEMDSRCLIADECVQDCEANGRVCPCYARSASRAACCALMKMSEESKVFKTKPNFPRFNAYDLVIGKLLGEGGFSEVHEARTLSRPTWRVEDVDGKDRGMDSVEGKKVEATELQESSSEHEMHAVKYLKRSVMVDRYNFVRGAADLAIEARFLSVLDHPHIIKLHGIAAGSVESNVAKGKECGFFIVIDRLCETLEDRIEIWRGETCKYNNLLYRTRHDHQGLKRRALLMNRLKVAIDIASTLRYLHSLNIVYRDLKPDNVGFDSNGTVKLFDFGLAEELKPSRLSKKGAAITYNLTGNAGSRRYMAPEVARALPYNLSVDVYSFAILLYEMCTLKQPFQAYSALRHQEEVVKMKFRPRIDMNGAHSFWPWGLSSLIWQCWSDTARERLTFDEVCIWLEQIVSNASTAAQEGNGEEQANGDAKKDRRVSAPAGGVESNKKPPKETRRRTWGGRPGRSHSSSRK